MSAGKQPLLYNGANTINCDFAEGVIVGEDTYAKDCKFARNAHINRRKFLQNAEFGDYSYTGHNTTIKYATIGK